MIRNLVRNNPGELRLLDLENRLRMIDHIALTRDGMHFNTQRGRHWVNDVFQTQLREVEQESRVTSSLARTSSTGGSRIRASVPESLVNRLGPLTMETAAATTVAPSSNVRERLGTAPPPRTQPLESRLGRSVVQNRNNSQTVSRRNDPPWPRQTLLQQQDRLRAPCQRRELNQAACCFGTDQTRVIGDSTRRTCPRSWT